MVDDHLLYRYIKGDADPAEKRQVVLWLAESAEHERKYLSLRKLNDLNNWNTSPDQSRVGKKPIPVLRLFMKEFVKIASVLFIGVLSTIFLLSKQQETDPRMQTVIVPPGQRAEVILSDGTEVWLNAGSTFSFPEQFTRQACKVVLNGEGFFKVPEKKHHPFTVCTGKYDIKVLGTEFNVKSYHKNGVFETSLLRGKIDIVSEDTKELISLKPDEKIVLSDSGLRKTPIADYNYFKWREGLICFEKENVATLFSKLELYYDIKICVENKSLFNYTYTGKLRVQDGIDHFMRVLQLKHAFEYIRNEETNSILIK